MSGEQKIRIAAYGLVAISAINISIILWITGATQLPMRGLRFALTCGLAFMLLKGANWARWFAGISCALAAVVGVFRLVDSAALLSVLGLWKIIMTVFYAWVACTLLLNKEVAYHFGVSRG